MATYGYNQPNLEAYKDDPIQEYEARVYELGEKYRDENYLVSTSERKRLLNTYNKKMYDMINQLYTHDNAYRTNENVEYAQKYLKVIGFYNDDVDGFYGDNTQKAMKKYVYEHSTTHTWEGVKDFMGNFWPE